MDYIEIEGVTPSAELREQLAEQTVLLSFSRGKDCLAAWLALRDAGARVIPYHLYLVPGLRFVEDSLAYYADWFGCDTPILNLPHPSLNRWLNNFVFQPPERCEQIEAAQLPEFSYAELNDLVRAHCKLPADAWILDGVRAADSPNRRMALKSYGPINQRARTQKIVWDWRKHHVYGAIEDAGLDLPPDYAWFGRSFDGIDRRFLQPLQEGSPEDYQTILDWFPLADLELVRAL